MKNSIFLATTVWLSLLSMGCSHSIKIKGGRFVAPVTADKQWGGFLSLSAGADTRVRLVDDIDDNPPTRDPVRINQDIDVGDLFGLNYLGFEAGLSVYKAVEVYLDNSLLGLRWQFLNHGAAAGNWVAALQAGYSSGSQGTSYEEESGASKASSDIKRAQAGLSVGYKATESLMPYLSYLHESYDVETKVGNANGAFGPYEDKGKHQYLALGVMRPGAGFLWAIEYNFIFIDWERATERETQDVVAIRLGGSW